MRRAAGLAIGACALLALGVFVARWISGDERAAHVAPSAREDVPPAARAVGPTTIETSPAALREVEDGRTPELRAAATEPTLSPSAATTKGLELSGRVVDDLGRPVEAFEIALVGPGLESTTAWPKSSTPLAAGGFLLRGLGPGEWRVVASVATASRRSAPAVVELPAFVGELLLVVPRAGALVGRVLDGDGVPIAEAEVHLREAGTAPGQRRRQDALGSLGYANGPRARTKSDRAGAFAIPDLAPGVHELLAAHADYCSGLWKVVEVAPGPATDEVELRLTRGGSIDGLVETAPGGVEDLKIGLFPLRGEAGWSETRTDAQGRFRFAHVFPGEYIVDHTPRAPGSAQLRRRIEVREGATTEVVFGRPERPVQLVGRAVRGGAPVAELRVVAHRLDGDDRNEEAASAADGSFAMELGGAGRYELIASLAHTSFAYFEIDVPDAPTHEVVLDLPGGRVTGRVTGSDGAPLFGIPVTVLGGGERVPEFDDREHLRRTRTDAEGRFAVELLAPGSYTVRAPDGFQRMARASFPAHGRALSAPLEVGPFGNVHVDLQLPPEGRIAGTLVDAFDKPVDRARIGALDAARRPLSAFPWEVESDGTGAFELGFLAPGTHTLVVHLGERTLEFPAIDVEAGRTTSARLVVP